MSQQVISQDATLDDIIFKDKNREFGAFLLKDNVSESYQEVGDLGFFTFCWGFIVSSILEADYGKQ